MSIAVILSDATKMIFNVVRSTFCNKMCTTLMSGLLQCLWYAYKTEKKEKKLKKKFLLLLLSAVFQLVYIVCAALLLLLLDGCLLLYLFTSAHTAMQLSFFLSFRVIHSIHLSLFHSLSLLLSLPRLGPGWEKNTHIFIGFDLGDSSLSLSLYLPPFLSSFYFIFIQIRISDKVGSLIPR